MAIHMLEKNPLLLSPLAFHNLMSLSLAAATGD
jgi:hypothetical protein